MMRMRMRMTSVHLGTLMLFVCSGVEGGGGCQEPVCPSGDGRCGMADRGWPTVTISGKIASAESSCQAPLADEEVRLYTAGCAGSSAKEFNAEEPAAAVWKTGKDGAFQVSVPFPPGTSLLRTQLCLTPRRACQPLTLNIPAHKSPSYPGATSSISAAGGLGGEGSGDGNRTVRVNLCLGEKRRRRRLAGWGDRDMSWLRKKKSAEEEKEKEEEEEEEEKKKKKRQDPSGKKRGWSNGIPWLKRHRPPLASIRRKPSSSQEDEKRLWEGADDEVGWIKRHPADEDDDDDDAERARPGEKQLPAGDDLRPGKNLTPGENLSPGENLPPNDEDYADDDDDDGAPNDGRPGRRRSTAAAKETARPSRLAAGHWPPRPEEMKKYWAQSDMSWL